MGGDGFYYFSAYFVVLYDEYAYIYIRINGERLCTGYADRSNANGPDPGPTSCSVVTFAAEGKNLKKSKPSTKSLNHKITSWSLKFSLVLTIQVTRFRLCTYKVPTRRQWMMMNLTTWMPSPESESKWPATPIQHKKDWWNMFWI